MAKQALGRGLGSLLGEMEVAYNLDNNDNAFIEVELEKLKVNPFQPRKYFDKDKLQELSDSIVEHGLLQPIVISKHNDDYLIIAGERRYRASKLANLTKINAIILNVDNKKLRQLALIENIQRDDLNIIEVASSYKGLIDDYQITHEELAKMVSKSRSSISNILRLLTLDKYVQDQVISGKISLGHAKLLVSLESDFQKTIATTIINQHLSVRDTEVLIKKFKNKDETIVNNKIVSFDLTPLNIVKQELSDNNLKIKVDDNYFKIKIDSQDDIEKIVSYFINK